MVYDKLIDVTRLQQFYTKVKALIDAKASKSVATTSVNGLMSSSDKTNLDDVVTKLALTTSSTISGNEYAVLHTGTAFQKIPISALAYYIICEAKGTFLETSNSTATSVPDIAIGSVGSENEYVVLYDGPEMKKIPISALTEYFINQAEGSFVEVSH